MKTDTQTKRESRTWWAVANGDVRKVVGYSCAPSNPDMWWCPEIGFTGTKGHHLFELKAEAITIAMEETERDLDQLKNQMDRLKQMRAKL